MMVFKKICLMVLCWGTALAQSVVPITSEPDHHLTISNRYVRVFKVEVPPKAETLYHQHDYDYLYVAIGDADVTSTRIHEKPVVVKLKDGEVEFSKGPFAHKARNLSDRPFRNVTVELLKGGGESLCGRPGVFCGVFEHNSGVAVGEVLATSEVSVKEADLRDQAGIAQLPHPYLLVAVSAVNLQEVSHNGTQQITLQPGEVAWSERPDAKLQNFSGIARFIVISFSDAKPQ